MNPKVGAVVFDLGGVLVETRGTAMMMHLTGQTSDELWRLWLASPAVRQFETGRIGPEVFAVNVVAEFALDVAPDEFLAEFLTWPAPLVGAPDLVERIPTGIKRATLSNTNALHWDRFVNEMRLDALFDHHFASHLTGKIKPDSDAFEHCASVLESKPGRILFLDDQTMNVDAAQRAGFLAVRVSGVLEAQEALVALGVLD